MNGGGKMNWIRSNVHPLKGTKDAPEEYIVVVEGATASTTLYWDGDLWHDEEFTPYPVLYWMPLPDPPKEARA